MSTQGRKGPCMASCGLQGPRDSDTNRAPSHQPRPTERHLRGQAEHPLPGSTAPPGTLATLASNQLLQAGLFCQGKGAGGTAPYPSVRTCPAMSTAGGYALTCTCVHSHVVFFTFSNILKIHAQPEMHSHTNACTHKHTITQTHSYIFTHTHSHMYILEHTGQVHHGAISEPASCTSGNHFPSSRPHRVDKYLGSSRTKLVPNTGT